MMPVDHQLLAVNLDERTPAPTPDLADADMVDAAYELWLQSYRENSHVHYKVWGSNANLWTSVCRGAGSVVDLFPRTLDSIGSFHSCCGASLDDAWHQDWISVGSDIYRSLIKYRQGELSSAGTSSARPTKSNNWGARSAGNSAGKPNCWPGR